ncbi:MAG: hypothetical protein ABJ143_03995, partial [Parasphingorhabdus sp.]
MRIFFLTGLMAATVLTPAAALAVEIAPDLDSVASPASADLTGPIDIASLIDLEATAEQQRDRRSERRANRGNRQANR